MACAARGLGGAWNEGEPHPASLSLVFDLKTKLNAMKLTDTIKYPLSKNNKFGDPVGNKSATRKKTSSKKFGETEESATVLRCSKCSYSTTKMASLNQHMKAKKHKT